MKQKIVIFLPTPNEVQRFLLEGAFSKLETQFDLTYVLTEADREKMSSLIEAWRPSGIDVRFIDVDAKRFKIWSKLFKTACYQYADKSKSFALRINAERYAGKQGDKNLAADRRKYSPPMAPGINLVKKIAEKLNLVKSNNQGIDNNDPARMFAPETFHAHSRKALKKLGINHDIEALLNEIDPISVIVPSSLLDPFCGDVIQACKAANYSCTILQSGWDNLSSKGILTTLPTHIGVWGDQSRSHAVKIQGMSQKATCILGAPHYEALVTSTKEEREKQREKLGVATSETLILFGGSFRQFDETQALKDLDRYISDNDLKCKILYRPHPYRLDREGEDDFFAIRWNNIIFDEEMMDRYQKSKVENGYIKRERPIYSMSYLANIISCVDAVLSPMSTLLLESMILQRPAMAIAFSDGRHSYSASSASEMTHFDALKKRDAALIWCDNSNNFLVDFQRLIHRTRDDEMLTAQKAILADVVATEPNTYADRLLYFVADQVVPAALNKKRKNAPKALTISHHYSADLIIKSYVAETEKSVNVPGYWMHGWMPEYFNQHYGQIALHKKFNVHGAERLDNHEIEKETEFQWVSRQDQADFLTENGYKKAYAIGLPFAYLPAVDVERKKGSLLVMPPHGRKEYFRDVEMAEAYVRSIIDISDRFSEIVVCVTERDYARGEWREVFQDANIPVIIGSNHAEQNPLLRLKQLLSRFEFVTTNAFGSHIVYAAHCGAKVSIFGPFCEWRKDKKTHAVNIFPELANQLVDLQSEYRLSSHFPFLFTHPAEAGVYKEWADHEIGVDMIKTPDELKELFNI